MARWPLLVPGLTKCPLFRTFACAVSYLCLEYPSLTWPGWFFCSPVSSAYRPPSQRSLSCLLLLGISNWSSDALPTLLHSVLCSGRHQQASSWDQSQELREVRILIPWDLSLMSPMGALSSLLGAMINRTFSALQKASFPCSVGLVKVDC